MRRIDGAASRSSNRRGDGASCGKLRPGLRVGVVSTGGGHSLLAIALPDKYLADAEIRFDGTVKAIEVELTPKTWIRTEAS